ncbi:polysaccharide deacetylase [Paenibacillus sp. GCM10027627]|uniref:YkoP family protein n=1 Tax=unclassified Paenibacillus TaxID=185978 RepID=UPI00363A560A
MVGLFYKNAIRSLWMMWEGIFASMYQLGNLHTLKFGICKVMIKKHKGESILCKDGTLIVAGDRIGELHLDNVEVVKQLNSGGANRAAIVVARRLRASLEDIHFAFDHNRCEFSEVKALVGVTLLHRGIVRGLGFEQQQIKSSLFRRVSTSYLRLILSVLHPEGNKRIDRRKSKLVPMRLVHTRNSLKAWFTSAA